MRRITVLLLSASLLLSCVKGTEEKQNSYGNFTSKVEWADTKTDLLGSAIRFSSNETLTVVSEGFNKFVVSNTESKSPNIFQGKYGITGESGNDCEWYTFYPEFLKVNDSGVITGELPKEQAAPFDPAANLMYSDIVVADYDEENMPELSFSMNQMMGLIRITFVNDNEEYVNDILQSVQLRASVPLCGNFSMDIHNPGDITFEGNTYQYVSSLYSSKEALGVDTQHWVTLFVNPLKITGAKLIIRTDKHTFTYKSTKKFTPRAGAMTLIPLMDLEDFEVTGPSGLKKRVVCWGDSYTSANYEEKATYCKHLQVLLGEEWEVYNGGISGDRTDEIAARQGALPLVTGSAFTIPAQTNIPMQIDGLLKTRDILGNSGYFNIRSFGFGLADPCKLVGTNGEEVLCTIRNYRKVSGTDTTYYATLSRVKAGTPVEIAEHTPIETRAARELRDVDLTIIYMGANGSFGSNSEENRWVFSRLDNLVDQHWDMINYAEKSDSYLVLGRHNGLSWDNLGYSAYMESVFGNRYLNLRLPVVESKETVKSWLLYAGCYTDESEIPQSEIDDAVAGNWPLSLRHAPGDSHPNDYGAKVIAKIVYDRMVELGYLDY